jgi:hypothetical protein
MRSTSDDAENPRLRNIRQAEQERRDSLLGVHAAQAQHRVVVARDLPAHDPVQMSLQRRHFAPERLEIGVGDHADLGVLERDRVDAVQPRIDSLESNEIASHLESRDLFPALARRHDGLEETGPDLKHCIEPVPGSKQRLALAYRAQTDHHTAVDSLELAFAQAGRQAASAQMAGGALHLARTG